MSKIKIGDYVITGKHGDWVVTTEKIVQSGKHKGEITNAEQHFFARLSQAMVHILNSSCCDIGDEVAIKNLIKHIRKQAKIITKKCDKLEHLIKLEE